MFKRVLLSLVSVSCLVGSWSVFAEQGKATNNIAFAIHGGAGTILKENMTPEKEQAYLDKLDEAREAGYALLLKGGSAQDAVLAAIQILEDSPLFNAGIGAVYNFEGEHELDASVMDGKTKMAGAVAGVKRIKNPILLATDVMQKSDHVMLSGVGAESFAESLGYDFVDNKTFNTERRFKALQKAKLKMTTTKNWYQASDYRYGTVGAVALDKKGNLFAGTSTGGMTAKRFGRIGDAPIIGAGTFADNASCAVSATGHGEYFIRFNVAADICARVKYKGVSIAEAGREVLFDQLLPAGGTGGVIIVDPQGNVAMPFNTSGMYRASTDSRGNKVVAIYK